MVTKTNQPKYEFLAWSKANNAFIAKSPQANDTKTIDKRISQALATLRTVTLQAQQLAMKKKFRKKLTTAFVHMNNAIAQLYESYDSTDCKTDPPTIKSVVTPSKVESENTAHNENKRHNGTLKKQGVDPGSGGTSTHKDKNDAAPVEPITTQNRKKRSKVPICHFKCAGKRHWTYECPKFKILEIEKWQWKLALQQQNLSLWRKLQFKWTYSDGKYTDELSVFYTSVRKKAKEKSKRAKPSKCHFCPRDDQNTDGHWTSNCPIGAIHKNGVNPWTEILQTRNPDFYTKLARQNALNNYYMKCLGRK